MLISSISLSNIRSYIKQEISFQKGINVLYGSIGSGKSTILLAIEVALFGLKKGEGNFILRKGTNEGTISITLKNASLNDYITIIRTFKRTKTGVSQESGQIIINDEIQDLSTQELNLYIFNYFNFPISFMNKDKTLMYRFTHYTPQEQLKEILTTQSDKRLEILRKVFNIDKYKQLQQASSITSKQFGKDLLVHQTKIGELPQDLEELISKTQNQIELQKKEIIHFEEKEQSWALKLKTILSNKKILEGKKAKYEQNISRSEKIKNNIEKSENVIQNAQKEKSLYTKDINSYNEEREKLVEFEKIRKEELRKLKLSQINIETLYEKIQKIHETITQEKSREYKFDEFVTLLTQIRDLKQDIVENESRIKDIEVNTIKKEKITKKIQKKQIDLKKFQETLRDTQKIIIEKKTQVNTFDLQIKSIENSMNLDSEKRASNEDILCPTCEQVIDENHFKILRSNYLSKKKELDQTNESEIVQNLEKKISAAEQEIELLKQQEKSFDKEEFESETLSKQNLEIEEKVKILNKKKNEEFTSEEQEKYLQFLKEDNFKEIIAQKIDCLEKEKKELQLQIETHKNQLDLQKSLENKIQKNSDTIQKYNHLIELRTIKVEELNKVISEHNLIIKENSQELDLLKKEVEFNYRITQKIKDQEEKEITIEKKKTQMVQKISHLKTKVEYLEKEQEELKTKLNKKKSLENEVKNIEFKREFLQHDVVEICKILEETLFVEIHTDLSKILLHYFKELIEEQDIDIMIREDFSVIVEQNGYEVEVEQLSGGEKSALALSYRLALKEVIEKHFRDETALDYIILDEPTDGFSRNQIQKFASILQNSDFKQIFLVSHDSNLLSSGEYVYAIEKENHVSTIELSKD